MKVYSKLEVILKSSTWGRKTGSLRMVYELGFDETKLGQLLGEHPKYEAFLSEFKNTLFDNKMHRLGSTTNPKNRLIEHKCTTNAGHVSNQILPFNPPTNLLPFTYECSRIQNKDRLH